MTKRSPRKSTARPRTVLTFPRYDRDLLPRPLVAATLLTVAQSGNEAAIRAFCEEWGIETRPPEWQFAVDDRRSYSRMLEARARMNTAVVFDDQEEMPDEARREAPVLAYFAAKDAATAEARAAQWATGSGQSPAGPALSAAKPTTFNGGKLAGVWICRASDIA